MKTILLASAVALAFVTTANAGDNSCNGTIAVGSGKWTFIKGYDGEPICWFVTDSKIGRKILRTCPDKSVCDIGRPLPGSGDVEAAPPSNSVLTDKSVILWIERGNK